MEMIMNTRLTRQLGIICALASMTSVAHAQFGDFGFGGDQGQTITTPAWQSFHLNPKTRVILDFREASPDAVLHYMSRVSGIAIVKDPNFKTPITLESPGSQSLDDAFSMLDAVLGLDGYEIDKQGNFLMVQAKPQRFGRGGGGFPGGGGSSRNSLELKVYRLQYASASSIAKVISDVFAPTPQAANAANGFAGAFGVQGQGAQVPGGGGGFGGRRRGGFGAGGDTTGGFGSRDNVPTVKASSDDYSNSLIVNAAPRQQDEIANIIAQIDKPTDQPEHARVYKLTYAVASDLASVVQSVLQASTPLGRGNTSSTSQPRPNFGGGGGPGGFFRAMLSSASSNNSAGTVTADTRTNSLVVTSTDLNLDAIDKVVKQLDQPTQFADTTFVYPLKNARADVVANLLNEAFGNRETNGPTGGSLTNTNASQTQINTTITGNTALTSSTPGSSGSASGNRSPFGSNQTVTSSSSSQSIQGLITSLNDEGQVVNARNLAGQVLLVPNIDTNSIIVVAPPNLQPIVKRVLDSMDEIPAQVMIEAVIMEVDLTNQDQFGVEWSESGMKLLGLHHTDTALGQSFGLSTGTGIGATSTNTTAGSPGQGLQNGLTLALTAGKVSAFINAVAQDNKTNILSTPRIVTSNNATAQINISESVPYESSETQEEGVGNIISYSFLNVGVILTVTPRITDDGYVMMDVSQTANTLIGFLNTQPEVDQRESQATVSIKDGETVLLGGLIQNSLDSTVNKVPVLGDLPLIGSLFRSTNKTKGKTELLVFLTPHVIRNPEDARSVREIATEEVDKDMRKEVVDAIRTEPTTPAAPNAATPPAGTVPDPNAGASAAPVITPMHVTTSIVTPGQASPAFAPTTPGGTITVPSTAPAAPAPTPAAP